MKAAIIKDFLSCRLYLRTYAIFALVFMGLGFISANPFYASGIFMILPVMCLVSTFALDETSKWERLALCSSLNRKDLVSSKYILGFILILIGFLLNLISISLVNKDFVNALITSSTFGFLSIFYICFMAPLMFKFGAEKSRIYMMLILVIPAGLILGFSSLGAIDFNAIVTHTGLLTAIVVVLFILLLIGSYFLSIKIVSKKDY